MSKEYPVEIYPKPNERIKDSAERIYDLGFRDGRFKERLEASNPLAGWSNLTEAIADGERIDWERLDGLLDHIDKLTRRLEIYEARLGRVARNHPEAYAQALAGDAQ